jgi:hypothetical protein
VSPSTRTGSCTAGLSITRLFSSPRSCLLVVMVRSVSHDNGLVDEKVHRIDVDYIGHLWTSMPSQEIRYVSLAYGRDGKSLRCVRVPGGECLNALVVLTPQHLCLMSIQGWVEPALVHKKRDCFVAVHPTKQDYCIDGRWEHTPNDNVIGRDRSVACFECAVRTNLPALQPGEEKGGLVKAGAVITWGI